VDDVLVDGMRGRSSLWWRVRVNLRLVPEEQRPPAEPPDPDYDPWANVKPEEVAAWKEAQQLRRPSRKNAAD
jgi:bifunctional non-homologous end joining protein LigD